MIEKCRASKKIKYPSEATAEEAMLRKNGYQGFNPGRVYKCPDCGCWHFTRGLGGYPNWQGRRL